jgi:hypothetical protein
MFRFGTVSIRGPVRVTKSSAGPPKRDPFSYCIRPLNIHAQFNSGGSSHGLSCDHVTCFESSNLP